MVGIRFRLLKMKKKKQKQLYGTFSVLYCSDEISESDQSESDRTPFTKAPTLAHFNALIIYPLHLFFKTSLLIDEGFKLIKSKLNLCASIMARTRKLLVEREKFLKKLLFQSSNIQIIAPTIHNYTLKIDSK